MSPNINERCTGTSTRIWFGFELAVRVAQGKLVIVD